MSNNIYPPLSEKYYFPTIRCDVYTVKPAHSGYAIVESKKEFLAFEDSYDYINDTLGGVCQFDARQIAESNPQLYLNSHGAIVNKESYRMMLSISNNSGEILEYSYSAFRKIAKKYLKNRNSFYYAYYFLMYHPAFWQLEGDLKKDKMLFWHTDQGLASLWHSVYKTREGETKHLLEHGPCMDEKETIRGEVFNTPNRTPSHDIRLDVVARTYEKAIIKLAKRVNKFYLMNGEERPSN